MASASKRTLWKGAISFGLVHIPVALHSATEEHGLNFDWLDKRTMDPVGYKRINKKTGQEVTPENIVKGIKYEDDSYVILSPEEIKAAYPKTTQTIEIEAFVAADAVPFIYLERPYYISPINKGAKVYALLREILTKTGMIGLAKVVIQTKQHLAVLVPFGPLLVLNLLRWGDEIRTWEELDLPKSSKSLGVTDKELKMGEQLVKDMSGDWNPQEFTDSFKEQILQLVEEKAKAGDVQTIAQSETDEVGETAKIYDLAEMLRRSLKGKAAPKKTSSKTSPKTSPKTPLKTSSKTNSKRRVSGS